MAAPPSIARQLRDAMRAHADIPGDGQTSPAARIAAEQQRDALQRDIDRLENANGGPLHEQQRHQLEREDLRRQNDERAARDERARARAEHQAPSLELSRGLERD